MSLKSRAQTWWMPGPAVRGRRALVEHPLLRRPARRRTLSANTSSVFQPASTRFSSSTRSSWASTGPKGTGRTINGGVRCLRSLCRPATATSSSTCTSSPAPGGPRWSGRHGAALKLRVAAPPADGPGERRRRARCWPDPRGEARRGDAGERGVVADASGSGSTVSTARRPPRALSRAIAAADADARESRRGPRG